MEGFTIDSLVVCVPMLHMNGSISNSEYVKYLLDETGTYVPKLIRRNNANTEV